MTKDLSQWMKKLNNIETYLLIGLYNACNIKASQTIWKKGRELLISILIF
jgi:hypothetical protein